MRADPSCPRCAGRLQSPGLWSSDWVCDQHGAVAPLQPAVQPTAEALRQLASVSQVPVWCPWPLPKGWLVTGLAQAGDERTGARASAVACSGPAPLGGVGELVLIAEEPGIGLGAHLGGLEGPDPGAVLTGSRRTRRCTRPVTRPPCGPSREPGPGRLRRRGAGVLAVAGAVARERGLPAASTSSC